jgi:hypothetical protein
MTKILVNNSKNQMIFDSFTELKNAFKTSDRKIRTALEKGLLLKDETTGQSWFVDILFTKEDLFK